MLAIRFINPQQAFDDGYQQGDDNQLHGGLNDMEELNDTIKHRTNIENAADRYIGKLTHHIDASHYIAGSDFEDRIVDAVHREEHDALAKHNSDLRDYVQKHNLK